MSNFDREMTICRDVLVQNGVSENTARHMAYRLAVGLLEDREKARRHRVVSYEADHEGWTWLAAGASVPTPHPGHTVEVYCENGRSIRYRFLPGDVIDWTASKPNSDSPWAKNWDVV